MIEVVRAAAELQNVCASQNWRFCFIGGLALQRWGEPRETVDADLTLLTGFGREEPFIKFLLARFQPRIEKPLEFALQHRVLLLRAPSGVGLDVALGGLPFEESLVARSSLFSYPGPLELRTRSAEDLVVLKSFAARPKDWVDVEGVIIRQAGRLDWQYIRLHLAPLVELKGAPKIMDELEQRRLDFEKLPALPAGAAFRSISDANHRNHFRLASRGAIIRFTL